MNSKRCKHIFSTFFFQKALCEGFSSNELPNHHHRRPFGWTCISMTAWTRARERRRSMRRSRSRDAATQLAQRPGPFALALRVPYPRASERPRPKSNVVGTLVPLWPCSFFWVVRRQKGHQNKLELKDFPQHCTSLSGLNCKSP